MAKLRSTIEIACFAYNRFVKKHIETEMIEKIEARTSTSRKFIIVDNAVELVSVPTYNDEMEVIGNSDYWQKIAEIRRKEFTVDTDTFNQLYAYADSQITETDLTPLEREVKREEIAFFIYFTNDFLSNENSEVTTELLYSTNAYNWEIV